MRRSNTNEAPCKEPDILPEAEPLDRARAADSWPLLRDRDSQMAYERDAAAERERMHGSNAR